MNTDQAFKSLTESQKQSQLQAAGWKRKTCAHCDGRGTNRNVISMYADNKCRNCGGAGITWEAPLTR
jgi:DnaJ-class molecular chaperone